MSKADLLFFLQSQSTNQTFYLSCFWIKNCTESWLLALTFLFIYLFICKRTGLFLFTIFFLLTGFRSHKCDDLVSLICLTYMFSMFCVFCSHLPGGSGPGGVFLQFPALYLQVQVPRLSLQVNTAILSSDLNLINTSFQSNVHLY